MPGLQIGATTFAVAPIRSLNAMTLIDTYLTNAEACLAIRDYVITTSKKVLHNFLRLLF